MISLPADGKIKIVRVIARLNIGGPAIHVVNLTAGLDPARFEQLLVAGTENPGEGSMLDYAFSRGVRPFIVPELVNEFNLKPRDLKALAKLCRLLRQERPHIVHTHTARAGLLGRLAGRLAGVPIVVHTYHGHVLHGYFSPVKTWLMRSMERTLARMTDQIITVSERVKHELVSYSVAPPTKIAVIPLGFDLNPFLCCQDQKGRFRHELGVSDGAQLVSIVGRIFPIKNHRLFLDAAARVATREPSARFVIVGDGVLRPEMEHHARELGIADQVIFTGWRRDLPRIYADTDILVVSSNNEGTAVSAIEAMAAGRPVIATRVGGLPDLIAEGETGLLVPPGDPGGLAVAVLRLLQDPEAACRMGQRARAMVRERFSVHRLIAAMENLYHQLLAQKGIANCRPTCDVQPRE
jgi:glycosyltransferase involved in cell wall biosynthesis